MPDLNSLPPQRLFKQWREGDPAAGQAMAQRFSDWYYAVTASRLGDIHGRGPLQRSCTRFQQGIMGVTKPEELTEWAHAILADEVKMAGGRIPGGDFPNQLTGGRSPTEILKRVRGQLSHSDVVVLGHAYDSSFPIERVQRETADLGGMPVAVLRARYALKRALRDHAGIVLTEVPDEPNLDYAPLPLYEAGRMKTPVEEAGFEKWLLTNLALCRDIAEFGVFALALRHGAYADLTEPPQTAPRPPAQAPPAPAPIAAPPAPAPAAPAAPAPVAKQPTAPKPVTTGKGGDPFAEPAAGSSNTLLLVVGGGLALLVLFALLVGVAFFLGFV